MKKDDAKKLFENFNCAQALLAAYAPGLGVDEKTAFKIASGFGGGMAGLSEVCGAVTGAFMVIGLKYGKYRPDDKRAKDRTYIKVRKFAKRFAEEHGTLICRDLIGCDISTEEGLKRAREEQLFSKCPGYVESAARILEEIL